MLPYLAAVSTSGIQINKFISSTGYCSRREADKLIEQGRVTINDELAQAHQRVGPDDKVCVDFEYIKNTPTKKKLLYIAFNKPVGITSTTDVSDRSNIISYINHPNRIFPVGRLDKDSEGLILLTNDGDIVNKILRAGNQHEKEYVVTVNSAITPDFIRRMSSGIEILGTRTKKCVVRQEGSKKFRIILKQGLNRQIRRMCEACGYSVMSLQRVRIMHLTLGSIKPGKWRYLSDAEVIQLEKLLANSSNDRQASL